MASADLLILLSDIDGLYTAPPAVDPDAKLIPVVESITSEIEGMAGSAGSELSRGGMTILLSSHMLDVVQSICSRVALLSGHASDEA